jgi:hypothetical protein
MSAHWLKITGRKTEAKAFYSFEMKKKNLPALPK